MNQYIKDTQNTVYNSEALRKYSLLGSDVSVPQVRITQRTVLITSIDVPRPTPHVGGCGGAPSDSSSDSKGQDRRQIINAFVPLAFPLANITSLKSEPAFLSLCHGLGILQKPSRFLIPDCNC